MAEFGVAMDLGRWKEKCSALYKTMTGVVGNQQGNLDNFLSLDIKKLKALFTVKFWQTLEIFLPKQSPLTFQKRI